jgi:ribose transport system substrate-binding protein
MPTPRRTRRSAQGALTRRRMIAMALGLGSALAMTGGAAGADTAAEAPAQKKIVIGLIAKSQSNPVFLAARTGANDAAAELGKKHGIEIEIDWQTPANEDAQKQAELLEQLINKGAAGIAVSCSDAKTLTLAINAAVEKGIPVACFDSDAPESKRFAYYGTDDFNCGTEVAKELAQAMGDKGSVAILAGNQTAPNLQSRVRGVKEELARHKNIKVVDTFYHKETAQDAVAKMEEVQRTNPQITGWALVGGWPLFTKNAMDNIAPAAKVVSVDALEPQLVYVRNGQVQVLLGQKVYEWGFESVRLLVDKIVSDTAPSDPIVKADLVRVTKENADEYGKQWDKWLGRK